MASSGETIKKTIWGRRAICGKKGREERLMGDSRENDE